jgi:sugar lactone lactonase YvrE
MPLPARIAAFVLGAGTVLAAILLYRTVELGRDAAQPMQLEPVNPAGELTGPRGIQFDARGKLYVGDARGRIWTGEPGERLRVYADLGRQAPQPAETPIQVGGMAFDPSGALYVCAHDHAGGSILRVSPGGGEVRLFAGGLGVAADVVLTADGSHLWVSDHRRRGRLLRYRLDGPAAGRPDLEAGGLEYPSGLALGAGDATLYAVETYAGRLCRVALGPGTPRVERVLDLKGALATASLDGLAFDPRDRSRRFLYVAENLRGLFTVADLQARPPRVVKQLSLARMGGRPCPASLVIHDGYVYCSDVWACSPIRLLLGMPELRTHAYRFHVSDLAALY